MAGKGKSISDGSHLQQRRREYLSVEVCAIMLKWTCTERIIGAPIDYGQNEHSVISFALH